MKAIISRTLNGAWMRILDKSDEAMPAKDLSYRFDDDVNACHIDSMLGLADMLRELVDCMGWSGDRRDKMRIKISIVHGDKFEHDNEAEALACEICASNVSCGYKQ